MHKNLDVPALRAVRVGAGRGAAGGAQRGDREREVRAARDEQRRVEAYMNGYRPYPRDFTFGQI